MLRSPRRRPIEALRAPDDRFETLPDFPFEDPAAEDNRNAWKALRAWNKPFLTAFSDQDAITRGGDRAFQREVPGCAGQRHTTIVGGGHFLQEDEGEQLARVVGSWLTGK